VEKGLEAGFGRGRWMRFAWEANRDEMTPAALCELRLGLPPHARERDGDPGLRQEGAALRAGLFCFLYPTQAKIRLEWATRVPQHERRQRR
jgi:hypothetical protein